MTLSHAVPTAAALSLLLAPACSGRGDSGDFSRGLGGGSGTDGGDDTAGLSDDECPAGMLELQGGAYSLGERNPDNAETWSGTIIPVTTVRLEPYCVDRFPLPGREGDAWPQDGLSWSQVEQLAELLPRYGRRLCSVSELLFAASGPENWRLPYHPSTYEAGICDIEANTPSPIGSHPDCASPLGARDFMVRSSWATLDPFTYRAVRPQWDNDFPGDGSYAVYGGTSAQDTFYAPSNYGIHFYGPRDPAYTTDGLRTCAAVGIPQLAVDDAWAAQMAALAETRSFATWVEGLAAGAGRSSAAPVADRD
ncbi:MAG: hypothetical protein VX265_08185 [Myxococcota bacterium]|nr:hypothetical protein [Myxococcota bacterium]